MPKNPKTLKTINTANMSKDSLASLPLNEQKAKMGEQGNEQQRKAANIAKNSKQALDNANLSINGLIQTNRLRFGQQNGQPHENFCQELFQAIMDWPYGNESRIFEDVCSNFQLFFSDSCKTNIIHCANHRNSGVDAELQLSKSCAIVRQSCIKELSCLGGMRDAKINKTTYHSNKSFGLCMLELKAAPHNISEDDYTILEKYMINKVGDNLLMKNSMDKFGTCEGKLLFLKSNISADNCRHLVHNCSQKQAKVNDQCVIMINNCVLDQEADYVAQMLPIVCVIEEEHYDLNFDDLLFYTINNPTIENAQRQFKLYHYYGIESPPSFTVSNTCMDQIFSCSNSNTKYHTECDLISQKCPGIDYESNEQNLPRIYNKTSVLFNHYHELNLKLTNLVTLNDCHKMWNSIQNGQNNPSSCASFLVCYAFEFLKKSKDCKEKVSKCASGDNKSCQAIMKCSKKKSVRGERELKQKYDDYVDGLYSQLEALSPTHFGRDLEVHTKKRAEVLGGRTPVAQNKTDINDTKEKSTLDNKNCKQQYQSLEPKKAIQSSKVIEANAKKYEAFVIVCQTALNQMKRSHSSSGWGLCAFRIEEIAHLYSNNLTVTENRAKNVTIGDLLKLMDSCPSVHDGTVLRLSEDWNETLR